MQHNHRPGGSAWSGDQADSPGFIRCVTGYSLAGVAQTSTPLRVGLRRRSHVGSGPVNVGRVAGLNVRRMDCLRGARSKPRSRSRTRSRRAFWKFSAGATVAACGVLQLFSETCTSVPLPGSTAASPARPARPPPHVKADLPGTDTVPDAYLTYPRTTFKSVTSTPSAGGEGELDDVHLRPNTALDGNAMWQEVNTQVGATLRMQLTAHAAHCVCRLSSPTRQSSPVATCPSSSTSRVCNPSSRGLSGRSSRTVKGNSTAELTRCAGQRLADKWPRSDPR